MPRIPRGYSAGHAYHVLNRGNGGVTVFHKHADYAAFIDLLDAAKARHPITIFGFCLMPNHFHLVVAPTTVAGLSPFMQWWVTSHVRRYHRYYRSHGHVCRVGSKVFRFNTMRTFSRSSVTCSAILSARGLVEHARDWPWSSLRFPHLRDPTPIEVPTN